MYSGPVEEVLVTIFRSLSLVPLQSSMDYISDEGSDISDSEIDECEEKYYLCLKGGEIKLRKRGRAYRCPFCVCKKKLDFDLRELLQHASGIGLSNRKAKLKATHRALDKYLRNDFAETVQLLAVEPPHPSRNTDEQFVWPWMGILVNVPRDYMDGRYVGTSGNMLKEQLSCFSPSKVHILWDHEGHTGKAVVDFSKDWVGFINGLAFEKHFEVGKRDYLERKHQGMELNGWVARADDYNSGGVVGDHLRKKGDLKTLSDLANEESRKSDKLLAYLTGQIEVKNKSLEELEFKYNQTNLSLEKMTEQRDQLFHAYNQEIQNNKELQAELESKMRELDLRREQPEKLAAQSDSDKRKLGAESVGPLIGNFDSQSPGIEADTVEIVEKVREFRI